MTPTGPDPSPTGYGATDWAKDSGARWAANADRLEAQLAPIAVLLDEAAGLEPGDRVLDVGCGRGATTRDAAARVAPTGRATGLDISETLLAEAAALAGGIPNVDWIVGDAQVHPFDDVRYDALISRFGVMFFTDPTAAFANLHRVSESGARLTMITWQARDRSPLFELPLVAAFAAAAELGVTLAGEPIGVDEGPFSLGTAATVEPVLTDAGWRGVTVDHHTLPLHLGGPGPVESATDLALDMGAVRTALAATTPEQRAAIHDRVAAQFAPHHDGTGVALDGAIAIVRAVA